MSALTTHDELEARAASGNADAQFELGIMLMSGPNAATDAYRGIAMLESASARGHARATQQLAVLEAMGAGRMQNWAGALDLLQLAAEQGSTSAQAQLLLLSDNSRDPMLPAGAGAEHWRDLRSHIQIEQRLQFGNRRPFSDSPWVRIFEGFATAAECRWLISAARNRLKPATVFVGDTGELIEDRARSNSAIEFQVTDMDVVIEMLRARISEATRLPIPFFEPTQVLHYLVGQQFSAHHDYLDPKNAAFHAQLARLGQRVATFLIYLDDQYEGGETNFPAAGLSYRGRTGDALLLANVDRQGRPDPRTLHAGLPPRSGEKWILSQWIRDRSPGPAADDISAAAHS